MRKSRSVSTLLFRSVALSFSVAMLILSLLCRVRLMELDKEITELEKAIAQTETEAQLLKVKLENRISLSELERIASKELGMHRPTAQQIYFDILPG